MTIQHAWQQPSFILDTWEDICRDFRQLCDCVPGIVCFSTKSDRGPEISDDRIVFNGKKGSHRQPMCLTRDRDHEKSRLVCETHGLPYDSFATALLLIVYRHTHKLLNDFNSASQFGMPFIVTSTAPWSGWALGNGHGIPGGVHLVREVLDYPPAFIIDFHRRFFRDG